MAPNRQRGNGEGSVYREGSTGRWVAAVVIDGRRRRAVATTEAKAKRRLREMQLRSDRGEPLGDGNVTVGQVLTQWQRRVLPARELSIKTLESYEWAITVLNETLGSRRLRSLRPEDVESSFAALATKGRCGSGPLSRASLIKLRSVLGKVLDYAERRALINRNIARIVELPPEARRSAPGRALTVEQAVELLAAAAQDRLYALWLTMLMLGLRPGEATGLTWADVDLDVGVVHVRRALKLERGQLVLDGRLKTSRSRRSLDAPVVLAQALRQHRESQASERLATGPAWANASDLVFTTSVGSPLDPHNLRRSFARLTKSVGLGTWHPHELRHSAASILSAAGVPLENIADVLGHDGTRMTALVYRHAITPTISSAKIMGDVIR